MEKQLYSTPRLIVFGDMQQLTQGPVKPAFNDNIIGQNQGNAVDDNPNVGCGGGGPNHTPCPAGLGS